MKNRIIKVVIIGIEAILFYLIFISDISFECIFRKYLNIQCVGCGLTRAFKSILDFSFIEAFKYNILSIPLFLFLVVLNFCILYDIFKKEDMTKTLFKKTSKYYLIILALVIGVTIFNNIR